MINATWAEVQQLRQKWVWMVLCVAFAGSAAIGVYPLLHGDHSNNAILALVLQLLIPAIITVAFWFIRLETAANSKGISYRFFPLTAKNTLPWDDIAFAWVRKYKPLAEYGGWGIRYSLGKNGKAINIRGNMGLQLVFKNGKKLLIGTQQPEQWQQLLTEMGFGKAAE